MIEAAQAAGSRWSADDVQESTEFLQWLTDDSFIYLGYREYQISGTGEEATVVGRAGLRASGIMSDESRSRFAKPVPVSSLDPAVRGRIFGGPLVVVSKTNAETTIHRRARMDYIGVKRDRCRRQPRRRAAADRPLHQQGLRRVGAPDPARPAQARGDHALGGSDLGLARLQGGGRALRQLPQGRALRRAGAGAAGDDHGARGHAGGAQRARVPARRPDVAHGVGDRRPAAATASRPTCGCGSSTCSSTGSRASSPTTSCRLRPIRPASTSRSTSATRASRTCRWPSCSARWRPRPARGTTRSPTRSPRRSARCAATSSPGAMPPSSPSTTRAPPASRRPASTSSSSSCLGPERPYVVALQNERGTAEPLTRVKLYKTGGKAPLTELLPLLEQLGLTVVEEVPTRLQGDPAESRYLHDFGVLGPDGAQLDLDKLRRARELDRRRGLGRPRRLGLAQPAGRDRRALMAAGDGAARLPRVPPGARGDLHVPLPERLLRAQLARSPASWCSSSRPASIPPGTATTTPSRRSWTRSPPTSTRSPRSTTTASCAATWACSRPRCARTPTSARADRATCRSRCAARTCRTCPGRCRCGRSSSTRPTMAGVHLRGGMVARGGIRWSDRLEDYRTEVLGLMKAQMVKNAVIVPVGAKGGFVLKRPPSDRAGAAGGGAAPVHHPDAGHARPDRQHGRRRGRASARRARARRPRPLPRRRRRQGHRASLRHRQRGQRRVRLLARRRVRLGRVGRLRPQGARHHRPRARGRASRATSASSAATS